MLLGTLKKDREIKALLHCADNQLDAMGYTEHSFRHVSIVCQRVEKILAAVGCDEKEIEIGKIAGFLHDLGNCVNRKDHAHSGAILAYTLLVKKGMNYADAARVMEAIGNHDEETGQVASKLSAALILADKSDVHRTRVRKLKISQRRIGRQGRHTRQSQLRGCNERYCHRQGRRTDKVFVSDRYGHMHGDGLF